MRPIRITPHIYQVGGSTTSDMRDGAVYLINLGEIILIDSGTGIGFAQIVRNIVSLGLSPDLVSTVILTHCHIDHVGGAAEFKFRFGSNIVMHTLDAEIVERGDQYMSAAFCFNIALTPFRVDRKLPGEEEILQFGSSTITCLHTPGHTAGSIAVYLDIDERRILFGQDIGAPLLEEFKCDPIAWRNSMDKLIALEADILCEGHAGVYRPKDRARAYIEHSVRSHGFAL
ncbi:MAG: Metallo-beta-lactamase L1 precursor [Syntrophorhabdus sp. PtaB.Bin006]|nr:MAG: Metallo-beta-lactamase L1 precursor [Syntrophorhabdus sp. PtaB.Bin006]